MSKTQIEALKANFSEKKLLMEMCEKHLWRIDYVRTENAMLKLEDYSFGTKVCRICGERRPCNMNDAKEIGFYE